MKRKISLKNKALKASNLSYYFPEIGTFYIWYLPSMQVLGINKA